ncbi:hypothetical protein AB6A40_005507 [Gnathostoma spinigerum]|uniref:Calcineurin-like phosphoesterase domain-containing protein n=1 Tax=Gnathostoma spinigerum TaxID=75299 RepID=A0ABD6EFS8_9BILA
MNQNKYLNEVWAKYVADGRSSCENFPLDRLDKSQKDAYVRFVCIADTHDDLKSVLPQIPNGDILIHAGDITNFGEKEEIERFNECIALLPHRHKVVIAGNHDLGFEDGEDLSKREERYANRGTQEGYRFLKGCTYLADSSVEISGIKIYGTPWHPLPGYSFSRQRGDEIAAKWNMIPSDINVLITHTPPLGHGDVYNGFHEGCENLLNVVEERIKPQFHVFGHVHVGHGVTTNGSTIFINCATVDPETKRYFDPIIFDVPLQ